MSGRGTAGGVVFQAEVGAIAAGLMLSERPLSRLSEGLPGNPRRVLFETPAAVDDVLVETDRGEIYFQAKRTISLSARPSSELASVADQFVRQFRHGVIESGVRRDLDPGRDRLVLAVSDDAAATVANDLREALDRNRTGAATALPAKLSGPIKTFSDQLARAWLADSKSQIMPAEAKSLLSACSVSVVGPSQKALVEESLRDIVANVGDEVGLLSLLTTWAAAGSKSGVGADVSAARLWLTGKAKLIEPPSYRDDVQRLIAHSAGILDKLARFTGFDAPEGKIRIRRPVVDLVVNAAQHGHLALTGEPGAGKSAALHSAAVALGADAMVVTLTVDAVAISRDALRTEIGLQHPLMDVLANMPGGRPAYLVLDALDAVRGGMAEATYRKLVEEVAKLPGWNVVASVRTFDLRLGKEWRRLFVGTPPFAEKAEPSFPTVRHVHIGLLDAGEAAEVGTQSSSVASAISAGGTKMEDLTRNPFNLALVGDLLRGGVSASALATVATRGELLERYWEQRISDLGLPATVSLKLLVERMVAARSVDLPETNVPMEAASTVAALEGVGVLVTEPTRRIGFRHHVLFDYAVARVLLLPDRNAALAHLTKSSGAGLLISPSLGYWLEGLKHAVSSADYWSFIVRLLADEELDPIVKVECSRIAVEGVDETENLTGLVALLVRDDAPTIRAFKSLVGSILTKVYGSETIAPEPWANLLGRFTSPTGDQLGIVRGLLGALIDRPVSQQGLKALGLAARTLFDAMTADETLIGWLSPHVVPFVVKTYGTDLKGSRARLEALFAEGRFERFGYVEVPWLVREIAKIAEHDPEFLVSIFYRVFRGGNFSREQVTQMSNSWILPLSSNAAQDFGMAEHSLSSAFNGLLNTTPAASIRAFAAALSAERDKEHPKSLDDKTMDLQVGGMARRLVIDHSYSWAWNVEEGKYDDWAKLYREASEFVRDSSDSDLIRMLPDLILGETEIGLAWRFLFEATTAHPAVLGPAMREAASNPNVLFEFDTRRSATAAAAAIHPTLAPEQREASERAWLSADFSNFPRPEQARKEILGSLFAIVGDGGLETVEAKALLAEAASDGTKIENAKPFEVHTGWGEPEHWLTREGVDVAQEPAATLLALSSAVETARNTAKDQSEKTPGDALWLAVEKLDDAIGTAGPIDDKLDAEACDALAAGLGTCLAGGWVPSELSQHAIERLLELSHHANPGPLDVEAEQSFSESPSWGRPSPRIAAAHAINLLVGKEGMPLSIDERGEEMLLNDPNPAVRLQLVYSLLRFGREDTEAKWAVIARLLAAEANAGVLHWVLCALSHLRQYEASRLEPIVVDLSARIPHRNRGDDLVTGLIVFFALDKDLAGSKAILASWVGDYCEREEYLHSALFDIRHVFVQGFGNADPAKQAARRRSNEFVWSLVDALEPAVRSLPLSGKPPTPEETAALKLFNEIADQIYYGVGHDQLHPNLTSVDAQRAFLDEYAPLITKLSTLGTPRTVHHLIDLISKFTEADPARCFDLFSEAMLRTTGVSKYEWESMGASKFVELVGAYLADYRHIFDDEARRGKLVNCVSIFVEAGWPEARKLFQRLPELIQ